MNIIRSLLGLPQQEPPAPPPTPVTIRGIRFPADGSAPHLLPLTTTTAGVSDGPDAAWGHVPDLRAFWKTAQAWQWRDIDTFRLEDQPVARCNGLYVVFFSFDLGALPENNNFPQALFGRRRAFAGDAFIVRLQGTQIGEDLGEDGWAVWLDVPEEVLGLPVMDMDVRVEDFGD
ncbi:hypothetical protein B0T22DRAFT_33250 [Podospora appendiculata]|uniref:Uncharacterized protein n=1 Tax=Podospora appendiculata TaxID=314037 RepID=A0AAE0XGK5_9PEZI|nr:hypothetical protein B0T22DRAFT_33250 [Podospora appendiculata]